MRKQKILVIGSGGREHAICRAFAAGERVGKIFCADGNAGIGAFAECIDIKPSDIDGLLDFALRNAVDVTFAGGETSLALGVADRFRDAGLMLIGVTQNAARLESSKSFAKDFMRRHSIPTAAYKAVRSTDEARLALESGEFGGPDDPVVVKADGLAAGKGVVVATNRSEALAAIDGLGALAGAQATEIIVLEECLFGREVSLLAFCDGASHKLMPPVRDHKRIGDGDRGPNTGGMGTVADPALIDDTDLGFIEQNIVAPTLKGCAEEGFPFSGILFVGLMMTADGPKVLEYNARFGDPETQVILPLLRTDFLDVCEAIAERRLAGTEIEWSDDRAACVVLAARGYPGDPQRGDIIYGLDLAARHPNTFVYHAGTKRDARGHFITNGGRVLGVSATGGGLAEALDQAYLAVNDISWNGMQFRHDIGR